MKNNSKRVLHVVGDSKFGGGSVIITQLVVSQQQAGYDVSVLTTDAEFSAYLSSQNIKVVHLDCIWRSYNLLFDAYGILKLANYLRKSRFDVVHTHTTKAGFVGRVAAWIARTKYIVHTVHGFPFSETSSKFKVAIFSKLEFLLYKISTKVVFVSNYHLAWASDLKIIDSTKDVAVAIRNGVQPVHITKSADSPMLPPRIVFIGRMVKEKGIFDLLAAYQSLRQKYQELKAVFIGDGPDLAELKSLVLEQDDVEFTGFVTSVQSFICADDIFVLPSYREGLSISAIEAQSMGLASVLSDVGGNIEVADRGQAAMIFRTGDVRDLSTKLTKLLSDSLLRETFKVNAINNFNKNFTNDRMLKEYNQLYAQFN